MQRLGVSPEFGYTLLELLGRSGWEIARTTAFAGGAIDEQFEPVETEHAAVLVIAKKNGYEIRRTGVTLAAVAIEVFYEAARIQHLLRAGDTQLRIA